MAEAWAAVFAQAPCALLLADLDGGVLSANQAALGLLGAEQVTGRRVGDFLHLRPTRPFPTHVERMRDLGALALQGSVAKTGQPIQVDAVLANWDDATERVILTVRALSREQEAQAAQSRLQEALALYNDGRYAIAFNVGPDRRVRRFPEDVPEMDRHAPLIWTRWLLQGRAARNALDECFTGARVRLPRAWFSPLQGRDDAEGRSVYGGTLDRCLELDFDPLLDAEGAVESVLARVRDVTKDETRAYLGREARRLELLSFCRRSLGEELDADFRERQTHGAALRLATPPGAMAPAALGAMLDAVARGQGKLARFGASAEAPAEDVDLNACVIEAARMLGHLTDENIKLELNLGDDLATLHGPREWLKTAIFSLGRCATRNLPAGGLIRISTARRDGPTGYAGAHLLEIEDTGLGQPLNPNERTLVNAVVKEFDGVWVESERPGEGSLHSLYLMPREPKADPEFGLEWASKPDESEPLRVLVADDEDDFRGFLKQTLTEAGYEVECYAHGQALLDTFVQAPEKFGGAVLDVYMPQLGGLETYLRIHALRPEFPALFISGYGRQATRTSLLAHCPGAVAWAQKPITKEDLLKAFNRALRDRRTRDS